MMSKRGANTDFDTFVKRQQPVLEEGEPVDWAEERDEWLSHLKELYDQIEFFLAKYIKIGEIKCSYRDIALNEENIGSYNARQMVLKIGRQEIKLTPVGTLLIGAKGRVDVEGPAGGTRFLLVNSEASRPTIKVTVNEASPPGSKKTVNYRGKPKPLAAEAAPKKIKWAWKIATSPPTIQYIELTPESLFQALMEVANG
jgi:hypothetical protein